MDPQRILVSNMPCGSICCHECNNILTPPTWFCSPFSHLICDTCTTVHATHCSCQDFIPVDRIDNMLNDMRSQCMHSIYGCDQFIVPFQLQNHEETCRYAPCRCPLHYCGHTCDIRDLGPHLVNVHNCSSTNFFFGSQLRFEVPVGTKHWLLLDAGKGIQFLLSFTYGEINRVALSHLSRRLEPKYRASFTVASGLEEDFYEVSAISNIKPTVFHTSLTTEDFMLMIPNHVIDRCNQNMLIGVNIGHL